MDMINEILNKIDLIIGKINSDRIYPDPLTIKGIEILNNPQIEKNKLIEKIDIINKFNDNILVKLINSQLKPDPLNVNTQLVKYLCLDKYYESETYPEDL